MPATARQKEHRTASRPAMFVIRGQKSTGAKRGSARQRTSAVVARRFFAIVCFACGVLVFGGMASVWLNAEAVSISQRVMYMNTEIASQLNDTDRLELKRSSLASATRIERIATRELGMVPVADRVTYIEMSDLDEGVATGEAIDTAKAAQPVSGPVEALGALAQLTLGEAQVLLVGDIGLSSSW